MNTMNIALPSKLRNYVVRRVAEGGYGSVSEYMRELIRNDQRESAQQVLENELLKGLASGKSTPLTAAEWRNMRAEVKHRLAGKKSP
jgi:antitoxin ParD1/3/4